MKIGAGHGDYDIEVDLQVVGDAFLNGEGLRGSAGEPAGNFGPREVDTCEDEGDGPGGGVAAAGEVGFLGFGWGQALAIVSRNWCGCRERANYVKDGHEEHEAYSIDPRIALSSKQIKYNLRKASKLDIPPLAWPNVSSERPCSVKPFIARVLSAKREEGAAGPDIALKTG